MYMYRRYQWHTHFGTDAPFLNPLLGIPEPVQASFKYAAASFTAVVFEQWLAKLCTRYLPPKTTYN